MRWPRHHILWRSLRRRLCAGLTLVGYLLATLGLPLPGPAAPKNGERFPCENHSCGCQSAEQCWRSCCCHTAEERWAWARAHNVQPPAYAEKAKSNSWRQDPRRNTDEVKVEPSASCCKPDGTKKTCCQIQSADCHDRPVVNEQATGTKPACKAGKSWILGVAALKCQGLATYWATTGAALPPAPPLAWTPSLDAMGWLSLGDSFPETVSPIPPDPPPRSFGS
jgi:hypothetical protein